MRAVAAFLYAIGVLRCEVVRKGTIEIHVHGRWRAHAWLVTPHGIGYEIKPDQISRVLDSDIEDWQAVVSRIRAAES